jgi:hypothetical protein
VVKATLPSINSKRFYEISDIIIALFIQMKVIKSWGVMKHLKTLPYKHVVGGHSEWFVELVVDPFHKT